MLWEKQCKVIPDSHIPMAVCATPDDGFTMVGGTPGDAFIAHFIPKPVSAVVSRNNSLSESMNGFSVHVVGAKLIVSVNAAMKNIGQVSLFDISGKRIAMQTVGAFRETPLSFDVSKLARGTYVVRVGVQTLKICLNR
jgi:hypothetical protein